MKDLPNGHYGFDSLEDVIDELTNGRDSRYLVGFECPKCHRVHVADFVERLTPFSDRRLIEVPASIELTVEHVAGYVIPTKLCPGDGTPMEPIRTKANEWLFAHRSNAGSFPPAVDPPKIEQGRAV